MKHRKLRVHGCCLCAFLCALQFQPCQAAFEITGSGTMGPYALSISEGGYYSNPGELAMASQTTARLTLGKLYLNQEIQFSSFSISQAARIPFQVSYTNLGDTLYSEHSACIAGSIALDPGFYLGLRANYFNSSLAGFGTHRASSLSLGTLYLVSQNLSWGLLLENLIKDGAENLGGLPQTYATALRWHAGQSAIRMTWKKQATMPASSGWDYQFNLAQIIGFRIGYSISPSQLNLGVLVSLDRLDIIINTVQHPVLGNSSYLSVSWQSQ